MASIIEHHGRLTHFTVICSPLSSLEEVMYRLTRKLCKTNTAGTVTRHRALTWSLACGTRFVCSLCCFLFDPFAASACALTSLAMHVRQDDVCGGRARKLSCVYSALQLAQSKGVCSLSASALSCTKLLSFSSPSLAVARHGRATKLAVSGPNL